MTDLRPALDLAGDLVVAAYRRGLAIGFAMGLGLGVCAAWFALTEADR